MTVKESEKLHDMFNTGLVDEVCLRICPTTRGEGMRMFNARYDVGLIETKLYERGSGQIQSPKWIVV